MAEITLKKLTEDDAQQLQAISIETYEDTFGEFNTDVNMTIYLEEAYEIGKLRRELMTTGSEFYLLMVSDVPAAYLKINIDEQQSEEMSADFLEIERIYVRKQFKRMGLGNRLMELAVAKAKEKKKRKIWLGVWEHNKAALAFYRKWGFTHFSEHIFYMGDDAQTDYIFVKELIREDGK
ncbi:GNAT family N-acetyltransferase [Enterococcus sp. DIV0660C]|uniref:GNAT family N-acetyltransferase n=1 Tax=Enterococcus sp. DIV0660C TaxID=2230880 RepID=UPI001A8C3BA5|nr:GNAT family N-acetyltransferase [Enterococcus sp. DIV0660C]MBO0431743.1 GNAT family N-acetyltransferase [Enterococcus sp. DIV0660C]